MNIWALEGHKVTISEKSANSGYKFDSDRVKQLCKIGEIYTVDETIVNSSSTSVYLKEFPAICFNSVNFEDVDIQTEDKDELHSDWDYYN